MTKTQHVSEIRENQCVTLYADLESARFQYAYDIHGFIWAQIELPDNARLPVCDICYDCMHHGWFCLDTGIIVCYKHLEFQE